MTWNYRIIFHDTHPKEQYYGLHEVYYDADGSVTGWTENPVSFTSESKAGLMETLMTAKMDARKRSVLVESELDLIQSAPTDGAS